MIGKTGKAFYITGDTHGDQLLWDKYISSFLMPNDTIIVLGDFGMGFFDEKYRTEEEFFDYIEEQEYTVLFCDGNHENFEKLKRYDISIWNEGRAQIIRKNLIHLMRGEIYKIDGKRVFVFGGGFSVDKQYRVPGQSWWPDEMPNDSEYENARLHLQACNGKVDYILTHTAPADTVEYLSHLRLGIKNNVLEEYPLTGFLNGIQYTVQYEKWYFGHFHVDRELWRNQYALLDAIRELHTGELVKMRV